VAGVFCCWTRQHEPSMLVPEIPHFSSIPRQQECWPDGCEASRQAPSGAAVQRTTTASNSNAPFLPKFTAKITSFDSKHPPRASSWR